jgi:hypothetical protein
MLSITRGVAQLKARHARTLTFEDATAASTRGGGMGPAQCTYQNEGNGAVALDPTQEGTM